jgi:hypothetical protein
MDNLNIQTGFKLELNKDSVPSQKTFRNLKDINQKSEKGEKTEYDGEKTPVDNTSKKSPDSGETPANLKKYAI